MWQNFLKTKLIKSIWRKTGQIKEENEIIKMNEVKIDKKKWRKVCWETMDFWRN